MAELVEGRKYRVHKLAPGDAYLNIGAPNVLGKIGELIEIRDQILVFDIGAFLRHGLELVELPPIENEAATLEMMGFSDKEVASYMKDNKVGFYEPNTTTADKIISTCDAVKELLLSKNRKYGDSALSSGIAFNISPVVAIKARINDKLARLRNDNKDEDEDIISDLLGYFVLLKIAIENGK